MITLEKELTQAERAVQRNGFMRVAPHPTYERLRTQLEDLSAEIQCRVSLEIQCRTSLLNTHELELIKIAVDATPHLIYEVELVKSLIDVYDQLVDYQEYKSRHT